MSFNDSVSDMLTRIRNAQMIKASSVASLSSKLRLAVLEVLREEGYIDSYEEKEVRKGVKEVVIQLKYYKGKPVIKELKRVSKPGRRVYCSANTIPIFYNGLGMSIISTSQGVKSDFEASRAGIGGEVVCQVF